jgi:hypothetical protein
VFIIIIIIIIIIKSNFGALKNLGIFPSSYEKREKEGRKGEKGA